MDLNESESLQTIPWIKPLVPLEDVEEVMETLKEYLQQFMDVRSILDLIRQREQEKLELCKLYVLCFELLFVFLI